MHVGFVVYGPLDRRSGGYLYDRELADRLEAAGDEVTVLSLPERSPPARYLDALDPRIGRRLRATAASVDVLIVDELCHPSLAVHLGRLDTQTPVVALVHHLASAEPRGKWRARLVRRVETAFLRAADAYVCASRATRADVAAALAGDGDAVGTASADSGRTVDRSGDRPADDSTRRAAPRPTSAGLDDTAGDAGGPTNATTGSPTDQGPTANGAGGRRHDADAADTETEPEAGGVSDAGTDATRPGSSATASTAARTRRSGDGAPDGVVQLSGPDANRRPTLVAYPGADRFGDPLPPARVRERAREEPLRVLFVGSVTPRKRLVPLIEGLARVSAPWELTVVGDTTVAPAYVRRVRDRVDALSIHDRVTFAGRVTDADLRGAFERHHLLAVPSAYEGFGIVYVEGMGFGLPAIASNAGGAPETVRDRYNGRLVAPGDASAITDVIAPLARDRDRLADMGCAALETYHAHPTWDDTGRRVRTFLRAVADGAGADSATGDD